MNGHLILSKQWIKCNIDKPVKVFDLNADVFLKRPVTIKVLGKKEVSSLHFLIIIIENYRKIKDWCIFTGD